MDAWRAIDDRLLDLARHGPGDVVGRHPILTEGVQHRGQGAARQSPFVFDLQPVQGSRELWAGSLDIA